MSAILTRTTGKSTFALARDTLGITLSPWQRDPQGILMAATSCRCQPTRYSSSVSFIEIAAHHELARLRASLGAIFDLLRETIVPNAMSDA
jgi:hypothetical protein